MPTTYEIITCAASALRATDDPEVQYGILLLQNALIGSTPFASEVQRAAEGLIIVSSNPRVRLGIAGLAFMLGAIVIPSPLIFIPNQLELNSFDQFPLLQTQRLQIAGKDPSDGHQAT